MTDFFIALFATLFVSVLADLMISRITGRRLRGYATSFLLTLIGVPLVFVFVLKTTDVFEVLLGLGLGLMWWFIYLNVVQAVESSLRIRMLLEIRKNGGQMAADELRAIYNDETLIRLRMQRLVQGGAVEQDQDHWHLRSGKLKTAAQFFSALKQGLLGKGSQFD
ncbi:hypothetical protein [Sneathiella sp.]|jgi:hypothetical protein|uniref:hypothetical protein n=1 Tax=Sneathiella sp. TaxID=1964365 RepID=UPI0039E64F1F